MKGKRRHQRTFFRLCLTGLLLIFWGMLLGIQAQAAQSVYFGTYPQNPLAEKSEEETVVKEIMGTRDIISLDGTFYYRKGSRIYKEEPIEWYVVKDNGNSYVLMSRYVLLKRKIGNGFWTENLSGRLYLNTTWLNQYFSPELQRQMIPVVNDLQELTYESVYTKRDGLDTLFSSTDKVFFLSKEEFAGGDGYNIDPSIIITQAVPWVDGKGAVSKYWLRGRHRWNYGSLQCPYVTTSGEIAHWYGTYSYGMRPCICVSKNAPGLSLSRPDQRVVSADILENLPSLSQKPEVVLTAYNAVKLSWKEVGGAANYRVYIKNGSGKWKALKTTNATSMKKTKLAAGTKYSFKVVPLNAQGRKGKASPAVSVTTLVKVEKVKVKSSAGKANISWAKSKGCDGYQISVATKKNAKNDSKAYVYGIKKTSTKLSVVTGKKLYYKVRSFKKTSQKVIYGPWSDSKTLTIKASGSEEALSSGTTLLKPDTVTGVKAIPYGDNNNVQVSWKPSSTPTSYQIYAQEGKNGKAVQVWKQKYDLLQGCRALIDGTKLKEGKNYYFYVVGIDAKGQKSSPSAKVAVFIQTKVTGVKLFKDDYLVGMKWNASKNVSGYQICVSTVKKPSGSLIDAKNLLSARIPALAGQTMYYYVRSYIKNGSVYGGGPWSAVKSYKLPAVTVTTGSGSTAETTSYFPFFTMNRIGFATYRATYSDAYFQKDAAESQPRLAMLSCLGAAATYAPEKGYEKTFLDICGFTTTDSLKHTYPSNRGDNDHARATIGYRSMQDGHGGNQLVIAVLINGYNENGYEWISNFNIGKPGEPDHAGFYAAADEVLSFLKSKVKELRKEPELESLPVKYWIMGHSRGGAVTNIVAHRLAAENDIPAENIYAYGFATPRMTQNVPETKEMNIKNFLVPEDFVPTVAPESWGYKRYGTDVELTLNQDQRNIYFSVLTDMPYEGFTISERNTLTKTFCKLGQNQRAYSTEPSFMIDKLYVTPEDYAQNGLAACLTSDDELKEKGKAFIITSAIRNPDTVPVTTLMIYDGELTNKFEHAHTIETYVAAMAAHFSEV